MGGMRLIELFVFTALVALSLGPMVSEPLKPAGILLAFMPGSYVGIRLAFRDARPSLWDRAGICLSSGIGGAVSAMIIVPLGTMATESWLSQDLPLAITLGCVVGSFAGTVFGGIAAVLLGRVSAAHVLRGYCTIGTQFATLARCELATAKLTRCATGQASGK